MCVEAVEGLGATCVGLGHPTRVPPLRHTDAPPELHVPLTAPVRQTAGRYGERAVHRYIDCSI